MTLVKIAKPLSPYSFFSLNRPGSLFRAQPSASISPFLSFLSSPRSPIPPAQFPLPGPARAPSPLCRRQVGPTCRGPPPSSRARLGLEPESGHATPRCPSPWRTGQGLPRPLFKRRPTPLGPLRAAAAATAPNPSSRVAIAELGAPRRAAIPPFPLDVFSAPKVRVVVRMLSVSLSLPISFSRLRSRSPALRRLWSTP